MTDAAWTTAIPVAGAYADVNGLHLYYGSYGDEAGAPLVLLHGGLGSGEMFGPVTARFVAAGYRVVAPDLQGHGRTADIDRPMSLPALGDDVAALLAHLGIESADVLGYSMGGGAALQLATRHPELVRRLVLVSANASSEAFWPEMLAQQGGLNASAAEFMKGTPMYEGYVAVAPRPEDFGRLLDKMGAWMAGGFDLTEDLRAVRMPTLIVAGDADIFPPRYAVEMFELLGGGRRDGGWMGEGRPAGGHALAILPGEQHYTTFASPLLADAALAFLARPGGDAAG